MAARLTPKAKAYFIVGLRERGLSATPKRTFRSAKGTRLC